MVLLCMVGKNKKKERMDMKHTVSVGNHRYQNTGGFFKLFLNLERLNIKKKIIIFFAVFLICVGYYYM